MKVLITKLLSTSNKTLITKPLQRLHPKNSKNISFSIIISCQICFLKRLASRVLISLNLNSIPLNQTPVSPL